MSENTIEKIRKVLQKVLLPVIEKKNKLASKIHFSIELQISLRYVAMMLIVGVVIFVPVGQVLYHSELKDMQLSFHYSNQLWEFSLTEIYRVAILLYIFGMFIVVELSKKGIQKISDGMGDIIKSTNQITINNLEEERLNVEGIQNELKDIAVTINRMLDRLEVSYETQKQFVSDASHELRTPIAVIQGYVNMLDRWGAEDVEVLAESVEAIKNESQSMHELVEKLLFLSRHDKKTLKLNKKKFDIGKMIAGMVKEIQMVAKNRNVEVLDMESAILYGDSQTIKEAIRVLVENAIKYTEDGDTIYIGCEKQEKNCIITIADTGIGMEQKDLDNMFQRFYRSDNVRNGNISGHGLGLSIAKLIVLKHVGTIQVKSQYTRGTSFRIVLPLRTY